MFNFFKRRKINNIPNTRDIAFGFPAIHQVNQLLNSKDYDALNKLYKGLKNDEKTLLIDGIVLTGENIDSIFEWLNTHPEEWLANLFTGVAYTYIAWQERTGQHVEYLNNTQIYGFVNNLQQAIFFLEKAKHINPEEPETYSRLIRVYMGMGKKQEGQSCFDTLVSLDSNHLGGHLFMFNLLTPKWLGSFEEMKTFATQFETPESNDLRYSIFLRFAMEHFNILADENEYTAEKRFKKHYKSKVKKVYRTFNIPAISSFQRYYLHNYFSYIFYLTDENRIRNKEINLIGNRISFFPWAFANVMGERDLKLITLE